jgi:streptogramin lyase
VQSVTKILISALVTFMLTRLLAFLVLTAGPGLLALHGQTIDTVAGTGKAENSGDGPALKTNVGQPFGVEIGPDGALYICEVQNHRVRRLDPKSGALTTVAGSGTKGYAGDGGPATKAQLNEPYEVRFDKGGNMLFVEMQNQLVRKVDATSGTISTVAGTGQKGFSGDGGPATKATFSSPHSIALDGEDNLYIADIGNHRIRKVDARTGIVTTIAGNGERQQPVDGQAAAGKPMAGPRALVVEGKTLWIALREGHAVWTLDLAGGTLKHIAGTGKPGFSGDGGSSKEATFNGPKGIALGPDKMVYVVDTENHAIRRIDPFRKTLYTVAGTYPAKRGGEGDGGRATKATLDRPHGICVAADGTIYIGDTNNHRVRRVR